MIDIQIHTPRAEMNHRFLLSTIVLFSGALILNPKNGNRKPKLSKTPIELVPLLAPEAIKPQSPGLIFLTSAAPLDTCF